MTNITFAFPFDSDVGQVFTPTLSGGSWSVSLPLTNLQDRFLFNVARSSAATLVSTTFDIDLGVLKPSQVLAILPGIIGRSLPDALGYWSRNAKVRMRGSNAAGDYASPVYDTGWEDVFRVIYPQGSLYVGHPSFMDGKLSQEQAAGYRIPYIKVLDSLALCRYHRVEIDDTTNAAGYLDLARLIITPGYTALYNPSPGLNIGFDTDTTSERSLGGVDFFDRRSGRRMLEGTIERLPEDEAFTWPFEMMRLLDKEGQLFVLVNPDDTTHLHRRSFLATLKDMTPLTWPDDDGTRLSWRFSLMEFL